MSKINPTKPKRTMMEKAPRPKMPIPTGIVALFAASLLGVLDEREKKIRLTEKETNILKYLYRAQQSVVARDVLLHEVWGYNAGVTTHTLETHIYRLRQKIEPEPGQTRLLLTDAGGYRLQP